MVQRAKTEGKTNYISVTIKRTFQTIIPGYITASIDCSSEVMEKTFGKLVTNIGNNRKNQDTIHRLRPGAHDWLPQPNSHQNHRWRNEVRSSSTSKHHITVRRTGQPGKTLATLKRRDTSFIYHSNIGSATITT